MRACRPDPCSAARSPTHRRRTAVPVQDRRTLRQGNETISGAWAGACHRRNGLKKIIAFDWAAATTITANPDKGMAPPPRTETRKCPFRTPSSSTARHTALVLLRCGTGGTAPRLRTAQTSSTRNWGFDGAQFRKPCHRAGQENGGLHQGTPITSSSPDKGSIRK